MLDNGHIHEKSAYLRDSGTTYNTTADGTAERQAVINVFNYLY